jgi:predicted DNA-binding transcriptional regulator AlpA
MSPQSEADLGASFSASKQIRRNANAPVAPVKPVVDDALLHPRDAARMLNVSTSWLAKARLSGNGPRFVKIGRAVRYATSSLREYIKMQTRGSTSEN